MSIDISTRPFGLAPGWLAMLREAGMEPERIGDRPMRLRFDDWFARMQTPDPVTRVVRDLFRNATREIRRAFRAGEEQSWIAVSVLRGRLV